MILAISGAEQASSIDPPVGSRAKQNVVLCCVWSKGKLCCPCEALLLEI